MDCDIAVIGAGPGGCAAAYYLRQAGWQVTLVERQRYPVDKLCGEFLSPEGVESVRRIGLGDALAGCAAPPIREVLVSSVTGRSWKAPLPAPGLGCSRRYLDQLLVEHCRQVGVDVIQGMQIRQVAGNWEQGFRLTGHSAEGKQTVQARLVIGAFGKQAALHRKLRGGGRRTSHRLMALKLHIADSMAPGRVELHGFPGGYAGLCPVEGGTTNLCLLTKTKAFHQIGCDYRRFSDTVMACNPLLGRRLASLHPTWKNVVAVANLAFGSRSREAGGVLMVGDAAASISPLCGDGMAMALRAGEMLTPLLHRFLAGNMSSSAMLQAYERHWRQEFALRLKMGRVLQKVLLTPSWTQVAVMLLRTWPRLGQDLIRLTRGN